MERLCAIFHNIFFEIGSIGICTLADIWSVYEKNLLQRIFTFFWLLSRCTPQGLSVRLQDLLNYYFWYLSDTASLSPAMTSIVSKIREAILKELKTVYIRKGVTEYAPRMGQLLCLLTNEEARVFGTVCKRICRFGIHSRNRYERHQT